MCACVCARAWVDQCIAFVLDTLRLCRVRCRRCAVRQTTARMHASSQAASRPARPLTLCISKHPQQSLSAYAVLLRPPLCLHPRQLCSLPRRNGGHALRVLCERGVPRTIVLQWHARRHIVVAGRPALLLLLLHLPLLRHCAGSRTACQPADLRGGKRSRTGQWLPAARAGGGGRNCEPQGASQGRRSRHARVSVGQRAGRRCNGSASHSTARGRGCNVAVPQRIMPARGRRGCNVTHSSWRGGGVRWRTGAAVGREHWRRSSGGG